MAGVDGTVTRSGGAATTRKAAAVVEVKLGKATNATVGLRDERDDLVVFVGCGVMIVTCSFGDVPAPCSVVKRTIIRMAMASSAEDAGMERFFGVAEGNVMADVRGGACTIAVATAGTMAYGVGGGDLDLANDGSAPAAGANHHEVGNIAVRVGGGDNGFLFVTKKDGAG